MNARGHRRVLVAVFMAIPTLLWGCGDPQVSVEQLRRSGELVVLTRNAPTTWYRLRGRTLGPEHDLVRSFADYLGVEPRFQVVHSIAEILEAISSGRAHLAAAGLTRTRMRQQHYSFGPDYRWVEQQLVCRRGGPAPGSVVEMNGLNIRVIQDSSYVETLRRLQVGQPGLTWEETREQDTEELLEAVWRGALDCTVADSNIVSINRRYHPELVVALALTEPEPLAWVVSPRLPELLPWIRDWMIWARENGELEALEERYYGYIDDFDYVNVAVLNRRIDERLSALRPLFEQAGQEFGLPWTLLAAMGYQESHWNPKAKSPTGVRGLMMLTRPTAREMGVENRLDPRQSIMGGARYLRRLLDRMPASIDDEDRVWLALAAYNLGPGHVRDARRLAPGLDKDPDSWADMKDVLPLLSRKRFYTGLKYGYARGHEALTYVQRVRDFQNILDTWLQSDEPDPATVAGNEST
jgi:membrane-bound lytic murein transglycosylase F